MPTNLEPNCNPIPNPMFQRAMREIVSISNDIKALVVTSFAHNYLSGDIVRLVIPVTKSTDVGGPRGFGMKLGNNLSPSQGQGVIEVIDDTSFTIDINTTDLDPFVIPEEIQMCAYVIPIGSNGRSLASATQNSLE